MSARWDTGDDASDTERRVAIRTAVEAAQAECAMMGHAMITVTMFSSLDQPVYECAFCSLVQM